MYFSFFRNIIAVYLLAFSSYLTHDSDREIIVFVKSTQNIVFLEYSDE
jgi:hypothetical protein